MAPPGCVLSSDHNAICMSTVFVQMKGTELVVITMITLGTEPNYTFMLKKGTLTLDLFSQLDRYTDILLARLVARFAM